MCLRKSLEGIRKEIAVPTGAEYFYCLFLLCQYAHNIKCTILTIFECSGGIPTAVNHNHGLLPEPLHLLQLKFCLHLTNALYLPPLPGTGNHYSSVLINSKILVVS